MKLTAFNASLIILAALTAIPVLEITANACPSNQPDAPADSQTRTYKNENLGFTIKIPNNYRVMGLQNGEIRIVNPVAYDLVQCANRTQQSITWNYSTISITSRSINPRGRNLNQIVRSEMPYLEGVRIVNQNGKQIAVSRFFDEHDGGNVINISFLTPNSRQLVNISGYASSDVFSESIATLRVR